MSTPTNWRPNPVIPAFQRTPPAGHHDALAYRPACPQLKAQVVGDEVQWFVTLPSGENYILATTPTGQSTVQAYAGLDASGICKTGGVDVPIVSPTDAIAIVSTRQEVTPFMMQPQSSNGSTLWVAAVVVGAIGYVLYGKCKDRLPTIKFISGGDDGT